MFDMFSLDGVAVATMTGTERGWWAVEFDHRSRLFWPINGSRLFDHTRSI